MAGGGDEEMRGMEVWRSGGERVRGEGREEVVDRERTERRGGHEDGKTGGKERGGWVSQKRVRGEQRRGVGEGEER